MRRHLSSLALASVVLLFGGKAHAARTTPNTTAVSIRCSCDDAVGKAYIEAVKSELGKEAQYKVVSFDQSANPGVLNIDVVSMPVEAGSNGKARSVLSIVYTHDGAMVHQMIETCDRIPLADCAKNMVDGLHDVL